MLYCIGSFSSRLYKFTELFLRFRDHNFEKKAAIQAWISHTYVTVWTPMLGEAMLQVACGSSNLQN